MPRRRASRTSCVTKMEVFRNTVPQFQELVLQFDARYRVQRAEGFVEKQELRLGRECPRYAHALALAAGKLARITSDEIAPVPGLLGGAARRRARRRVRAASPSIAEPRPTFSPMVKCGKEPDFLNHVPDAAPELDEIPIGGGAVLHQHLAGGGKQKAVQHFERGSFSRAAAAEQNQRSARFDAEA